MPRGRVTYESPAGVHFLAQTNFRNLRLYVRAGCFSGASLQPPFTGVRFTTCTLASVFGSGRLTGLIFLEETQEVIAP